MCSIGFSVEPGEPAVRFSPTGDPGHPGALTRVVIEDIRYQKEDSGRDVVIRPDRLDACELDRLEEALIEEIEQCER